MEKVIYHYLTLNNNISSPSLSKEEKEDNQTFLECLLILSTINKININYCSLIEYSNKVINHLNQNNINRKNKNKNKKKRNNEIYFGGLNKNQFKVLAKTLNLITKIIDADDRDYDNQLIYDHPLTGLNNNNNNNNNNEINQFDLTIITIIKNNLNLINQDNNQQQFKKIKLNEIYEKKKINEFLNLRNNIIKNGFIVINESDYTYLLFKKIWGNLVIRNEIIYHLRKYNSHLDEFEFEFEYYNQYKFKNYLNILKLTGNQTFTNEQCKKISSSIEKLNFKDLEKFEDNSIPDTINCLVLGNYFDQKLTKNLLYGKNSGGGDGGDGSGSNNIIELEFGNHFNQSLGGPTDFDGSEIWLPRNLKKLKFGSSFQQNIYPGQLPNSLTSLEFHKDYNGIISPNSIPKSVTTLTFKTDKPIGYENDNEIPKSTTNLIFENDFDEEISPDDIPHNVTSIKFNDSFNSKIKNGSLPRSIKSIEFGSDFQQTIIRITLPPNITTLKFGYSFAPTIPYQYILPHSLTDLHFSKFVGSIDIETFQDLKNLKTLTINKFLGLEIEANSLPNSITKLQLKDYIGPLGGDRLPKSLTYLGFTFNNELPIPPNTLPKSITDLDIHGVISEPIETISNLIPPNLKTLYFSEVYEHDLSLVDWPESLNEILIQYHSDTVSLLSNEFFNKYIKIL